MVSIQTQREIPDRKAEKHGVCSLEAIGQLVQERINIWDNSPEEACIEKEKKEWLRQGFWLCQKKNGF